MAGDTQTVGDSADTKPGAIPKAAWFALFVLAIANLLNYVDRQIVSILAQSIKADLRLDDADLGFLLGTAFAVFYSVVGIAMGRISDVLPRKKVMAFGLALWSGMTALGGFATNFATLGTARIGVGVGEAVANPCSQSLIADLFPPRRRALALSIYLTGTFLGGAVAMMVGGWFLHSWTSICAAVPIAAACSVAPWKAALIAVGLPGLPLVLAVLAIREPARAVKTASTGRFILGEFATALPPFTLLSVWRVGGSRGLRANLMVAAGIAIVATALSLATGDIAQWASFGLGIYAVVTWGQIQSYRDKPLFKLTFGDPTFLLSTIATALIGCVGGAVSAWSAPYAMRIYTIPAYEIGLSLGVVQLAGSLVGVLVGGWAADRWRQSEARAPLAIAGFGIAGMLPCMLVMLLIVNFQAFLVAKFFLGIFASLWSGAIAAMIQELVLPRMRGSATASYSLVAVVVSSGTGPYWAGKMSTLTGSLTTGLLSMTVLVPIAVALLWLASRKLPFETPARRRERAAEAGEVLEG